MATVRTRNAPSPTGIPHIGNSRTALYDYLLAKKYGGQFLLRIEDTDQKRLVPGSIEKIYEIHDFLGLIPDEDPRVGGLFGPYIQTERLELYQKYAQELVAKDAAYEDEGAIRVKMPDEGFSVWKDLVQGKISIPNKEVDDKVLMKSSGIPTYHLAVVVDDHLMEITHALRGVEWIVSTPVHLFLHQALGWQPPIFGHLPLLLGPDRSKLSKRHGAKSVLEYQKEGYLPEAINNFLFYLGFSYHDNSELLTLAQMVDNFDETKLQKQNAIFDIAKLNYFNSAWIRHLSPDDFFARAKKYLPDAWLTNRSLDDMLLLIQTRITTLVEIEPLLKFFFEEPASPEELIPLKKYLTEVDGLLNDVDWTKESIEKSLIDHVTDKGYHRGEFFMALRLAVCGSRVTPPLTESMLILGKDKVVGRVENALK